MSNNCSNLYSPEPDVAGQAVFISFLVHTSVFLVLALVITPIVQLYIPIVQPEDEWREAGEVELTSSSRTPEQQRPEALGQTLVLGAPGEPPRLIYRCYCREAIQDAYTSQYITGVAFVVTAFVKINTISYYHLRVIYCLLAMNSIIGIASNFDRDSRLRLWRSRWSRNAGGGRPKSWKMIDFVYMINLAVFLAFSIFIFIKQDGNFSRCYKHNRILAFATWYWFFGLSGLTWIFGNRAIRSAFVWLGVFLAMAGFVAFQSWQIWVLTRTFRPKTVAQGDTDENAFTFGQILVLFMVVPLVGDFTAALMVDLRRIQGRNWNDALASFLNIFRVLIPYFVHNVIKDVRDFWRKLINSAFIQHSIKNIINFAKTPLRRFQRKTPHIESIVKRNPRLHKTNTIRLESQEGTNGNSSTSSSLPTSRSLQLPLPRRSSPGQEQEEGRIDDDDDGDGDGDGGRRPCQSQGGGSTAQGQGQAVVEVDSEEDPDAILPLPLSMPLAMSMPVPGSVRQRQSFPHE